MTEANECKQLVEVVFADPLAVLHSLQYVELFTRLMISVFSSTTTKMMTKITKTY